MMKIKRRVVSTNITPDLLQTFQKSMFQKFNPLISSMKKEYWNRISLPSGEVENWLVEEFLKDTAPEVVGDLLMIDPETLIYYKFERAQKMVEVGIITKGDTQHLLPFCSQLEEILANNKVLFDTKWKDIDFDTEIMSSISEISKIIQPSPQEVQAARFLEEEKARKFIEKLKGSGATSLYKLVEQKELAEIAPIVDRLEKMALLIKDFVVLCSKTGQPILKVSSRSALEETPQGANKCFICGKPLSQETIDEIVSCSDFGRKIIDSNYWLLVRILSALEKYGIPNEKVYVQMTENDIINLFLVLNEQSYLFILCNRKLTLDDAFFVNAFISAYSINHALIICTETLSALMKKHLENNNASTTLSFIDNLNEVDNMIAYFLMEREKAYLSKILESFSALTPIKIQDLVLKRVARDNPPSVGEDSRIQFEIEETVPETGQVMTIEEQPDIISEVVAELSESSQLPPPPLGASFSKPPAPSEKIAQRVEAQATVEPSKALEESLFIMEEVFPTDEPLA